MGSKIWDAELFTLIHLQYLVKSDSVRAKTVRYDVHRSEVVVEMTNGMVVSFPSFWVEKLSSATAKQIANVKIADNGRKLVWDDLKEDLSLTGIIEVMETNHEFSRETEKRPKRQ